MNPDTRLKIRHFFQKNQKVIIIVVVVIALLALINRMLLLMSNKSLKTTTYEKNTPIMDTSSEFPKKISNSFEDFIEKYVGYCNASNFVAAYNMISDDCKKNFFGNDYNEYVSYVTQKFDGNTKRYMLQAYSDYDDKYIYQVKIFDDFLATGLTGQAYRYQEEKFTVSYDDNGEIVFSVGNYIESKSLTCMASNDYMKVDVTNVLIKYGYEIYTVRVTNRSNYTIVIKDGNSDATEIGLLVGTDYRGTDDSTNVILEPGKAVEFTVSFSKFCDTEKDSKGIVFDAVRIMENYTGAYESAEEEENAAIDKFSMTISF
jgi:hypothetical protein